MDQLILFDVVTSPDDAIDNVKEINKHKIKFDAYLQKANVPTTNKFIYGKSLIESGLQEKKQQLKQGNFLGELGHPFIPQSDPLMFRMRLLTVDYKTASHRFKDFNWDSDMLVGKVETLDTPCGHTLANLIRDGVTVGFSFRGFGKKIETKEGLKVTQPFKMVTYDCVQNPACSDARLVSVQLDSATELDALCDSITYPDVKDMYQVSISRIKGRLLSNVV